MARKSSSQAKHRGHDGRRGRSSSTFEPRAVPNRPLADADAGRHPAANVNERAASQPLANADERTTASPAGKSTVADRAATMDAVARQQAEITRHARRGPAGPTSRIVLLIVVLAAVALAAGWIVLAAFAP